MSSAVIPQTESIIADLHRNFLVPKQGLKPHILLGALLDYLRLVLARNLMDHRAKELLGWPKTPGDVQFLVRATETSPQEPHAKLMQGRQPTKVPRGL